MSRSFLSVISLTAILALIACTEPPADEAERAESSVNKVPEAELSADFDLADTSSSGGQAYMRVCAGCHEQGLDKAPQRAMLLLMSAQSIHRAMTKGVMQTQSATLSDDQKIAVAEFLAGNRIGDAQANAEPIQCEGDALSFDLDEPPIFAGWGLTHEGTHAISTEVAGIDRNNVSSLKLKWAFAYPGAVRTRSQPGLAGGALYVGSHGGTVYAFDRETGCVRWSFDASAEVRNAIVISPWQSGDESAKPMAFFGDLIGNLYALDAITGEQKWRVRPSEHPNTTLTATPSLYEGTLYVPISSLEVVPAREPEYECCNFRGSVVAYDAITGEKKWQTFTIPAEPVAQGINAAGTQNYGPSGAPIWNSPAIDIKRNQMFIGTGENYSSPASGESDAIIAFDLTTGEMNWVFQATAGDAWNTACGAENPTNCPVEDGPDYDFGAGVLLAQDEHGRDYVVGGQKSGVVHALEPETGELLWQTKVGRGGIHAGVYFGMAAEGGRLYVPISDTPDGREYPEPARPGLYALDLKNGEYLWKMPSPNICREDQKFCNPGYPQSITTTPEIVIAGSNDGHLRIFDTETGKILWDYDTDTEFPAVGGGTAQGGSFGGGAGPLAYQGKLILNSGYGFAGKMPGNALLVFEVE
jgi:polyvinyl alcohol dehydrogenase (cytochrome)